MDLIFTDLDGTLLDHATYAWDAAQPAIDFLRRRGIPWILVTSKTRSEVEVWRGHLRNNHPFIVENGGAAYIPVGYFPHPPPSATPEAGYWRLTWGTPYLELVEALRCSSEATGCRVRGFHDLSSSEVAALCALSDGEASLAKQREYDEPFEVLDADRAGALAAAIAGAGLKCTRGGRLWHILGDNDKGRAVTSLRSLFEQAHGNVRTIGLGDGLNDASFLTVVDLPVVIRSSSCDELSALVPGAAVTEHPGPAGWNQAVLSVVSPDLHR